MEGSADRISGLPEGILHQILSFLLTKDVIQTAATCKRLYQVWSTLPYLDLGPDFFPVLPSPPVVVEEYDGDANEDGEGDHHCDGYCDCDDDGDANDDDDDNGGDIDGNADIGVFPVLPSHPVEVEDDDGDAKDDDEGIPNTQELVSTQDDNDSWGSYSDNESDPDKWMDYENGADDDPDIRRMKREKLFTFVEQTLTNRRMQGLSLQKFTLGVSRVDEELGQHLDRWVHYLVQCKIKELVLQVSHQHPCYNLPPVLSTATSIFALTLKNVRMMPSASTMLWSLRKLHLQYVLLDEQIMRDITNTCRSLEDLKLTYCHGLQRIIVNGLSQLRVFVVSPHAEEVLDEVVVEALNLELFSYTSVGVPCKFNLIPNLEGSLKALGLCGVNITNSWLCELISKLPQLEELYLGNLDMTAIKISSSRLKLLKLMHLFDYKGTGTGVGEAKIDAPNLKYFIYVGDLSSVVLNNLAVKEVVLYIEEVRYPVDDTVEELCSKLMHFLRLFDYSEVVQLECSYFEKLIFPMEMLSNLFAPLAHIKQLVLRGTFRSPPVDVLGELMARLLWICPYLDNLSFKGSYISEKTFPMDLFIKFNSVKVISDEVAHNRDSITYPWMRWRGNLIYRIVELKGIGSDDEVYRCIRNYFIHNTKLLEEVDGYCCNTIDCNLCNGDQLDLLISHYDCFNLFA